MKRLVLAAREARPGETDAATDWVRWEAEETALPDEDRQRDEIEEAAIAWTKQWGRTPLVDGCPARELLAWKGISLWWFAELYLHHCTGSPRQVRIVEVVHRLLDAHAPDEVETAGLPADEAAIVGRTCTARGVLCHVPTRRARASAAWRDSARSRWNTAKTVLGWLKAALSGGAPGAPADPRRPVLFLSHAAFWRERRDPRTGEATRYEHYFDRLLPALSADAELAPVVVAVGPEAAHRSRGARARLGEWLRLPRGGGTYLPINRYTTGRVVRETMGATREIRRAWRTLRRLPAVQQAFAHRGVRFFDLAERDLAGTLLLQLPWAVLSYEQVAEALRRIRPAALCLYAESSGWGRAALAAAAAAEVPTVAVQHGILYPHYFSYRHDPDEAACPRPTRTAVFGEAARRFLVQLGHFAPETLVTTGSSKFDELLERARGRDRQELRRRLGIGEGQRLLAVASRYRAIRRTHRSIGPVFADLLRAVTTLPDVVALVKPHPAEPAAAYGPDLRALSASRTRLLDGGLELFDLLHAADALVTVESLSAVEALVLDRPVVVLNMPSNLRELVDAGVALGVPAGEDPTPVLRAALFEEPTRERLAAARARYVADFARGADGRATARILALLHEVSGTGQELGTGDDNGTRSKPRNSTSPPPNVGAG